MCNLFIERFCRLQRSQEGARWLTGKWKSDLRFVVMPIFNFLSAFTEMTWFAQDLSLLLLVSYSSCLPHHRLLASPFASLSILLRLTEHLRGFLTLFMILSDCINEKMSWAEKIFWTQSKMTPRAYSGFLDPSKKEKDAMSQFFVNEQCYTLSFLLQIEGKTKFQANSTTPRLCYLFFFCHHFVNVNTNN